MILNSCIEWKRPLTNNTQSRGGCSAKRDNRFSKIQVVGQKYWEKPALASNTQFSRNCFGLQSRRFSPLVGYNHVA